ncbi:glycosyltransferase involved in cell wall biosynthesis [Pedobacter sp. UYP30]|uniref:hypothetical protein n=1 Tax=Pedobacter sp. UYP30 TaxID=1756400 RepID=UPI0033980FE7
MVNKITLISSGQPSLNPRLVKEADTLILKGYEVTVIYQYWNEWATELDKKLLAEKKWKAICVGGSPKKEKLKYFVSRVFQKVAIFLSPLTFGYFSDFAITRSSYFLLREAKRTYADLYIAHNLGALPAAVKAAKKNKAKCGFDAEDFHRLETANYERGYRLKKVIEDKYITKTDYLSTSSPQISKLYKDIYPSLDPKTILNVFNKQDIKITERTFAGKPVKLFWFSQTIGENRGLNILFDALAKIKSSDYELHLLGDPATNFLSQLNKKVKPILHTPIDSNAILKLAGQMDIGIASEPSFSINNDNALSNKIFNYILAGLAVVASDTAAQSSLLVEYPTIGKIYSKNSSTALYEVLNFYIKNPDLLAKTKENSFQLGQTVLNWENESKKFISIIEKTLSI